MLEKYHGKKIMACEFAGARINFNASNYSLCHEAEIGVCVLGDISEFSRDNYELAIEKHIRDVQEKESSCIRCSKCHEMLFQNEIRYITINTSNYCNSACIYCSAHGGKEGSGYNPICYLEEIKDLLHENCFFDWGGGEPTLNPYFEDCIRWITENGYRQRINTNGIIFSEETKNALKKGTANLRMSLDSGTRDCFRRVKGHEKYDEVWENIRRYREVSEEIYLKYNIFNMNSDLNEIDTFLDLCKKADIKHILIDAEISSYQPEKNAGPFFYTPKEHDAAKYLFKTAKAMGFEVSVSEYAYSVRAERDESGRLTIPEKYYDNVDWDVISNNIFPKSFPNNKQLIEYLDGKNVVVFGAGMMGKELIHILKTAGIEIVGIIDNDAVKVGTIVENVVVSSPEKVWGKADICYLVVGRFAKEQVKDINKFARQDCEIVWVLRLNECEE